MKRLLCSTALLCACLALATRADAEDPFELIEIVGDGRTVGAELIDLNGDARTDLLQIAIRGIPPKEQRKLVARYQRADGTLPEAPDLEVDVPAASAVYDLADLRDTPGVEMVLLRPDRVTVLSLAGPEAQHWDLPVPGGTVGAAQDERGLERLHLVWDAFGPEPWLLVPQLGHVTVMSAEGDVLSQLDVGARANYFVPDRPGLFFVESDIQLYFDTPSISVGDVDGDGRADIMAATRHDLRVYLRPEEGPFPRTADHTYQLGLVSEKDHIRGSGGVATQARDIDGDGRVDLVISHVSGSFADAQTETRVHVNKDGLWDLAKPTQTYTSESTLGSDSLIDLDGDGRLELVRGGVPFSVLEFIEALVTRAIDARVAVYRSNGEGGFEKRPFRRMKLDISLSFETFRTAGFIPSVHADLNNDKHLDLLLSGDGDRVEVFLGGRDRGFDDPDADQELDTQGDLRFGDLDSDGFTDLLIFDGQTLDSTTRIVRNRGILPGSPARLQKAER